MQEIIEEKYNSLINLINKIKDEDRKTSLLTLCKNVGHRFCLAPGSNRVSYHDCRIGGLYDHSLKVTKRMFEVAKLFDQVNSYGYDTIFTVAMFHDLGKIGNLEQDYYEEQTSEWHRNKLGELYTYNENMPYLQHQERSIWILNYFNIKLTEIETQAVLYHNGLYTPHGEMIKHKECILTNLLHFCDLYCSQFEK